jgi:peptide chain release factor 2
MASEDAWSSHEKMQELGRKKARLLDALTPFEEVIEKFAYIEDSAGILEEEEGEMFREEISSELRGLKSSVEGLELRCLLYGERDPGNAIITINPGAGGTESQDWAQMLMRMYLRWAERMGYETRVLDLQPAEEAGIKSATITVEGLYAYGYLKTEAGVHRLVRISPFDANKRRHTSFSAVLVYPEVEDDIDIDIKDDEIKVDTFRASGAGGQHVNKTSSAIRITHLPTGIVVSCQNDRSQYRNRETAMKILKSRLYDLSLREQEKEMEDIIGVKKEIAWGSQIRSYVLQPYRLVKDHRTGVDVGDVDSVLDGNIDVFIKAALKEKKRERKT